MEPSISKGLRAKEGCERKSTRRDLGGDKPVSGNTLVRAEGIGDTGVGSSDRHLARNDVTPGEDCVKRGRQRDTAEPATKSRTSESREAGADVECESESTSKEDWSGQFLNGQHF
mgnify:CR=1 FL=1